MAFKLLFLVFIPALGDNGLHKFLPNFLTQEQMNLLKEPLLMYNTGSLTIIL
jgi:hypothetical protein